MPIKTSDIGYIIISRYDLHGTKAIATGKVREMDGERQAEFFLISGDNPERKVWLTRKDISQEEHIEQMKLV